LKILFTGQLCESRSAFDQPPLKHVTAPSTRRRIPDAAIQSAALLIATGAETILDKSIFAAYTN
jgi:hypothetical protein